MANQRVLTVITLLNLGLLIFTISRQPAPVEANGHAQVLRGSGLEIVDAQGKVRASIQIMPAGPARFADASVQKDSKIYPETVLLRLTRPDGRPSVKIATSEEGSGLTLGGGIDPTYIVFSAEKGEPYLSLIDKDKHQQLIKP